MTAPTALANGGGGGVVVVGAGGTVVEAGVWLVVVGAATRLLLETPAAVGLTLDESQDASTAIIRTATTEIVADAARCCGTGI